MSKKAITARFEEKIFEEISQKAKSRNNSKAELIRKFVTEGLNFESEKNDINEINKKIDSILETINLLISENQKLNSTNKQLENNIFQLRKEIIVSTFLGEKALANNYSILKNITNSNIEVRELIEKSKNEAKSKAIRIIKNETNNINPRPEFLEIKKFKNDVILVDLDVFEENFYEAIIKNISEIRMQNDQVQIIVLTSKNTEESELLREAFSTFAQMTIFDIKDQVEDYKYTILDMLENPKSFSYANKYNVNLQKIINREVEIKEVIKEKEVIREKYRNTKNVTFLNLHPGAGSSFLSSNFAGIITKANQTAALIESPVNYYFREKFLKTDAELEELTQKEIEDYHLNFSKKYNIFQKIKKSEAVDYSKIKKINGVKLYTSEEIKNINFERQDYINLLHSTKSQYNIIDFSNAFEEFEKIIDQMDHIFFVFSDFTKSKNRIEKLVEYQKSGHDVMFLKNKHHFFEEEKTELLRRKYEINYMIRFPEISEKELKKEIFQASQNMNFEADQHLQIFKIFKNELFGKVRECFELEKLDIKKIKRSYTTKKRRNTRKKRINQFLNIIGLTAKIGVIIGVIYVAISVATSFSGNSWGL